MTPASRCLRVLAGLLLASTATSEDLEPHTLLDRMNEAVRLLDYEGRFVVQADNRLDAMYIVHRVEAGAEKERVVSLTGKPREIIRSDKAVACLVPGRERHINVERRARGRSFSPLTGVSAEQLETHYFMKLLEPGRVAGRDAYQILIQPRDDLRYGYRLFVDQESSLPLRSLMFDEMQQLISQMMFVELKIGRDITPIEQDLPAMEEPDGGSLAAVPAQRLAPPAWSLGKLPPGFQLNVHRRRALADSQGDMEHFIFSDGLASVSVYIQPHADEEWLSGESTIGAAGAVGRMVGDYQVVVVGEVPPKTLHWFARQVQAATP
jgi:sigma-E factor negative regulatory protein RseB